MRLVSVLKTMLQLSPEESEHLTILATGKLFSFCLILCSYPLCFSGNPSLNSSQAQTWGSYLHLWSGSK